MIRTSSWSRLGPSHVLVALLCVAAVVVLWVRESASFLLLATVLLPEVVLLVALALLGRARVLALVAAVRRRLGTAWRRLQRRADLR